jgi:hypothetical protein
MGMIKNFAAYSGAAIFLCWGGLCFAADNSSATFDERFNGAPATFDERFNGESPAAFDSETAAINARKKQMENDFSACRTEGENLGNKCVKDFAAAKSVCNEGSLKKLKTKDADKTVGIQDGAEAVQKISKDAKDSYEKLATSCEPVQKTCSQSCAASRDKMKECLDQSQKLAADNMPAVEQMGGVWNDLNNLAVACDGFKDVVDNAKKGSKLAIETEKEGKSTDDATGGTSGDGGSTGATAKNADAKKGGSGFQMPDLSSLFQSQPAATPTPAPTPVASTGCDNPAVTDPVCLCQRNPASCQRATASSTADGIAGVGNNTSSSTTPAPDPGIGGSGLGGGNGMQVNRSPSGEVGGKQGNGAGIGGGGGSFGGPGGRGGGAAAADLPAKGGGGFYGGSSSGGGATSGGSGSHNYSSDPVAVSGKLEKPDLKKFLPGGKLDPNRGPASIVGKDGVTGPNVFNWEKMHMQYQRLWYDDNLLNY